MFDRGWIILSGSLMSGILGSVTKLREKVADKTFWNKNGSVSIIHFLAFRGFLTFSSTNSLEGSRFLSAFSKAGQMMGTPRARLEAFAVVAMSVSRQSSFTPSSYSILTMML